MAWTRTLSSGKFQGIYRDSRGVEQSAGTFTQEPQALREAGRRESESREPGALDVKGAKIQWGPWFDLWHESRSLAFATDEQYRSIAGNWLMPHWSTVRLADITQMSIERWKKKMTTPRKRGEKPPCPPWTFRSALMLLKTSLNAAVADRRLAASPGRDVTYPDLPTGLERYLTPDEVDAITWAMNGQNALVVRMSVETGLRFGELAGLHWDRVDLQRGTIRVIEKFNQKNYLIDPVPKDKDERTVPMPSDLVGKLIAHRERTQPAETCGLMHEVGECRGDILFRGARGAPLKSNDWGKTIFQSALEHAQIEGRVRVHDMRHTYASWLIQEGVPLAEIAKVMGHSDTEVTKLYAHLTDAGFDDIRAALDRKAFRVQSELVHHSSEYSADGIRQLEQRLADVELAIIEMNEAAFEKLGLDIVKIRQIEAGIKAGLPSISPQGQGAS
ncbi:tyrosine-type recombinase/integrase [Amycolatopsis dendrobii]|uniref:Site-specific integrase n=1 Tax=Amycolatopsis dendrobii TaxID=2760662 RepID=A0A7W3VWE5_9PSEU|nr:site-specific integrase [Amycolatopsis dendrobii]MBB1153952.1 site-specific integrase [Amycolatopsis dendrobii]